MGKAPEAVAKVKGKEATSVAKTAAKKVETAAGQEKVAVRTDEKNKAKPVKKEAAQPAKIGRYRLLIGEFVPDKSFIALQSKVGKLYPPLEKKVVQRVKPMNRLFVGEFSNYESAAAELEKLKPLTRDAFSIEKDGKYFIYAGSYYGGELAASEMKRLTGKGVKIELQKVELPVSVMRLTAGRPSSKEDAQKAVARLAKQGVSATVKEAALP